ncbi:MAG TPA: anti-sigma factor [Myxococcales bacterium]|nr:anti-sigma factor [Myxococcales bacterium]
MPTLGGMATSTVGNEPFARIVESRKTSSWSIGVPIALAVVVAVAVVAYFAAKATQAQEKLAQVQQSVQQQQQMLTSLQQRVGGYETELNRVRDPGRTTIILQPIAVSKKGSAASSAWGAATWGEQTDGKSWMRLNAYGLQPPPAGKIYQLWFVSASGDSIPVGKVEPNTDGNSYLEGKDLPAMDQGKTAMVAIDDPSSKTHGQPLFQAALPKLTPEQHAAEPQK